MQRLIRSVDYVIRNVKQVKRRENRHKRNQARNDTCGTSCIKCPRINGSQATPTLQTITGNEKPGDDEKHEDRLRAIEREIVEKLFWKHTGESSLEKANADSEMIEDD